MKKFASDLLTIGNGDSIQKSSTTNEDVAYWAYGHVPKNIIDELIDKVYTNLDDPRTNSKDYLSERAILAIANKDVASINSKIMMRMPGELTIYWSVDRAASEEDEELFPTEYFNAFYEASLPPHKLCVKPGVSVMLLRNLDPPRLCNGTRLRITQCGKQIFEGEIMGGTHDGEKVMLFKTPLQSKENNKRVPTPFVRKQYPVRLAFAMTKNKSQRPIHEVCRHQPTITACFQPWSALCGVLAGDEAGESACHWAECSRIHELSGACLERVDRGVV